MEQNHVTVTLCILYCAVRVVWFGLCRTAERHCTSRSSTELPLATCRWRDCCSATAQMPTSATRYDMPLSRTYTYMHTHTHTCLTALCPGLPGWAGTSLGCFSHVKNIDLRKYWFTKTNLDFTEARDSECQWHQLGHMQVCTSLQIDNHASTLPLKFLQAGCPSCRPTNSVKALKAHTYIHTNL